MASVVNITPKIKDKVWKDFAKKSSSKSDLKNIFMGNNPTDAYGKIKTKLKKDLDREVDKSKKSLKPRKSTTTKIVRLSPRKATKSPRKSPKRTVKKSPRRSQKRTVKKSPRRSPKRTVKKSPSRK